MPLIQTLTREISLRVGEADAFGREQLPLVSAMRTRSVRSQPTGNGGVPSANRARKRGEHESETHAASGGFPRSRQLSPRP